MQQNLNLFTEMKTRRKYSKEFKQMAVERSKNCENIRVLAEELNIRPELIYRWRREAFSKEGGSFLGQGNAEQNAGENENSRLRKQLKEVIHECDTLKKALSIFAKNDNSYFNL